MLLINNIQLLNKIHNLKKASFHNRANSRLGGSYLLVKSSINFIKRSDHEKLNDIFILKVLSLYHEWYFILI